MDGFVEDKAKSLSDNCGRCLQNWTVSFMTDKVISKNKSVGIQ